MLFFFLVKRGDFFFDRKKKSLKFVYKIRRGRTLTNGWKWGKIKWKITAVQLLKMFFLQHKKQSLSESKGQKREEKETKKRQNFCFIFFGQSGKGRTPKSMRFLCPPNQPVEALLVRQKARTVLEPEGVFFCFLCRQKRRKTEKNTLLFLPETKTLGICQRTVCFDGVWKNASSRARHSPCFAATDSKERQKAVWPKRTKATPQERNRRHATSRKEAKMQHGLKKTLPGHGSVFL